MKSITLYANLKFLKIKKQFKQRQSQSLKVFLRMAYYISRRSTKPPYILTTLIFSPMEANLAAQAVQVQEHGERVTTAWKTIPVLAQGWENRESLPYSLFSLQLPSLNSIPLSYMAMALLSS